MEARELIPLIHTTGFLVGAALYGLLFWLSTRTRIGSSPLPAGGDRLPLVTAFLGLVWNVAALAALGAEQFGRHTPVLVTAVAYAALGFLPAVVIDSVVRRSGATAIRWIVFVGYAVALCGAVLQIVSWNNVDLGRQVLRATTLSFLALTPFLAVATRRAGNAWWIAAFAVFAASGIHMSDFQVDHYSWGVELLGHHASLPLAFAILIYDYRFAFGDLFLKRALSLVALIAGAALLAFVASNAGWLRGSTAYAVVIATSVLTAAAWAPLARGISLLVDRHVLRRPDYGSVRRVLSARFAAADSDEAVMDGLAAELQHAVTARKGSWAPIRSEGEMPDPLVVRERGGAVSALVAPTVEPLFIVELSEFSGGRRLLSDDYDLLTWACTGAARRIDALRIAHERCIRDAREQEMSRLTTQAELRALRAQINPHFLFNALNTVGFLIRTSPDRAWTTLLLLTELLRSSLRSTSSLVPLEEELKLVQNYLEIEKARFEERLRVSFDISPELERRKIPPFILQPLVENAVKHGISRQRNGGEIRVSATPAPTGGLRLEVRDSGEGVSEIQIRRGMRDGVGLRNIRDRLHAYYGDGAHLSLAGGEGAGTIATITIPAGEPVVLSQGEAIV